MDWACSCRPSSSRNRGRNDVWASMLASLPYVMALLGMLLNGWHSDRTGERVVHVAVPLACQGIGIAIAAALRRSVDLPRVGHDPDCGDLALRALAGLLADPHDVSGCDGGCIRDRVHQHDWQSGRVRRALCRGTIGGGHTRRLPTALFKLAPFPARGRGRHSGRRAVSAHEAIVPGED